jgi:hypothetical protein
MTDYQLRNLKNVIQRMMIELTRLQKLHNDATGVDFIISGPVEDEVKDCPDCMAPVEVDGELHFC